MNPAKSVTVPLWLAINLRKSTGCQIVPPPWFNVPALSELYQQELTNDTYQQVELHYLEIATLLLEK